jgi:hypothetical protein
MGADEANIEASLCAAIRIAKEQKSVSLERRAEATYEEYRRQKASGSRGLGFRVTSLVTCLQHPDFFNDLNCPGRSTAFRGSVFVIDLLAANCPASVSSVRQLLSWRLSNHTVYGDLERQLFYSF